MQLVGDDFNVAFDLDLVDGYHVLGPFVMMALAFIAFWSKPPVPYQFRKMEKKGRSLS